VLDKDRIASFASKVQMRKSHQWFFRHRIVIKGKCSDTSDVPICDEIVAAIG
jgi:hypothetical protein